MAMVFEVMFVNFNILIKQYEKLMYMRVRCKKRKSWKH